MNTILNIGLDTNTGEKLSLSCVLLKLSELVRIDSYKLQHSDTELTLIAQTIDFISNKQVQQLCDSLKQDAISLMRGNKGYLVHGKYATKDWGNFNLKYFIKA